MLDGAINASNAEIICNAGGKVSGDAEQLTRVFQNLISNAIKFVDDKIPQIMINSSPEQDHYVISIQDNGIGIAPEYHTKVFDLFERLHSQDTYAGSGLGLALCLKIIENHQGRIWIESDGEYGTTIHISLPAYIDGKAILDQ